MGVLATRVAVLRDGRRVTLRHAREDDAEALLRFLPALLAESSYLALSPGDPIPDAAGERAWVRGYTRDPAALLLLAEDAVEVVGTLDIQRPRLAKQRHDGRVGVALRRAWRGAGLGRAMMEAAIAWARANPELRRLSLSVYEANAQAAALYRSLGFRDEGRRVGAVRLGPGWFGDELLMGLTVAEPGAGGLSEACEHRSGDAPGARRPGTIGR